jgi:DNA helicase-2/ATP-dependent DNA helicase PcrA
VAEHYRRRFRHVLVDEYQDTNHAQYALVKELSRPRQAELPPGELCVVGDADTVQSTPFRGATIRNILEFERDFPDARTILLEQNYRSTQTILDAANAVIDRNTERKPQAPLERTRASATRSRRTWRTPSTPRRTGWPRVIDRLAGRRGHPAQRRGVFYGRSRSPQVFEEVFIRLGLPYKVVGGVRFYERKEVRDALAYLRAISNFDDTVNVRRISTPRAGHRRPGRGVRGGALVPGADLVRRRAAPGRGGARYAARSAAAIAEFVALLDELREMSVVAPPEEILEAVLRRLRLPRRAGGEHRPAGRGRVENLHGARQRGPGVHRAGASCRGAAQRRCRGRRTRSGGRHAGRLPRAGLARRGRRRGARRTTRTTPAWSR